MDTRYITIEREYGSGGTKIARRLAEETNIHCYGREILESVSKKQNISVNDIEKYEETATNSFLYSLYVIGQSSSGNSEMLCKEGYIFVAEQEEIQRLAMNGRAVFLGHCASEALKKQKNVVRVFIRCSDEEVRKERIIKDYGISETLTESTRKRFNKKRANYYSANTGKKWNDIRNYDIILDSGVLGIDGCVAVLKALL